MPVASCSALEVEVACVHDMPSVTNSSKDQIKKSESVTNKLPLGEGLVLTVGPPLKSGKRILVGRTSNTNAVQTPLFSN